MNSFSKSIYSCFLFIVNKLIARHIHAVHHFACRKKLIQKYLGNKKPECKTLGFFEYGGSGEIRTHGRTRALVGFQDRCIKPLCHASMAAII